MTAKPPTPASRAVVADPPGEPTRLTLYDDASALASIACARPSASPWPATFSTPPAVASADPHDIGPRGLFLDARHVRQFARTPWSEMTRDEGDVER